MTQDMYKMDSRLRYRFGYAQVERQVRTQQNTVVRLELDASMVKMIRSIAKMSLVEVEYWPNLEG